MKHSFWQDRWAQGQISFHNEGVHPLLVEYLPHLNLAPGARVFVPLCGKTVDVAWLRAQGCRVVGAELVESAVQALFEEAGLAPEVSERGTLKRYSTDGLEIYAGDIFDLTPEQLGPVDAVYDRAAIIALPPEMRRRYAAHMIRLTGTALQLQITFDYDQSVMDGPPFSVPEDEILSLYGEDYAITPLMSRDFEGGLKGKVAAVQTVRLLSPRT